MTSLPEQHGVIPKTVDSAEDDLEDLLHHEYIIFDYIVNISNALEQETEEAITSDSPTNLSIEDSEYLELLLKINSDFDFETLFNNPDDFPEQLKSNESAYGSPSLYSSQFDVHSNLKFYGFSALMLYYISEDDSESARETFEKYSGLFDEEKQDYLMGFFKSYVMHKHRVDPMYDKIDRSIERAYVAKNEGPNHHLLHLNFAESVATAFESDPEYTPIFTEIELEDEKLLDIAIDAAQQARALNEQFARTYVILLRLHLRKDDHESARESLEKAERYDQDDEDKMLTRDRRQQLRRSINIVYDSARLESDIEDAEEELGNINKELEDAVNRYRKNTLRFVGFFAALITFAITSVQILALSGLTAQEAGQVIAMLAGGMLIAFGGFGLILPVYESELKIELTVRSIAIVIVGSAVFALSYFIL